MKRSKLLNMVVLAVAAILILSMTNGCAHTARNRPNVIFIFTDQQTINTLSATGNRYLNTPAMDRLATNGVAFTNSYCTSPVCGPSRSSLLTGVVRQHRELLKQWISETDDDFQIPEL